MSILLAASITTAILIFILGVTLPRTAPDPVRARLAQFAERQRTLEDLELEQPFADRVLRPLLLHVVHFASRVMSRLRGNRSESGLSGLQKKLLLAGSPNNLTPSDLLGIMGLCMLGISGLIFLLMGLSGGDVLTCTLVSLIGVPLGYLMPVVWLGTKVSARQKEIQRAMPDSLDLLVISVEAGLGFDAAVQRLTEKSDHALAREFRRTLAEIQMGRTRRDAMREMAARTEVPDLTTFVSAIVQADQLGVSVSRVLTVQADQMRMLRRQRAEEAAAKAPLKMLFPMVLLIFPAMFVVILGPSIVTLTSGPVF